MSTAARTSYRGSGRKSYHSISRIMLVVIFFLQLVVICPCMASAECTQNIASSYTCVIAPNYWGWNGPIYGNTGQLTDGYIASGWNTAQGMFYELPSSMGWSPMQPVIIFDLGSIRPIGGIGLHTALSIWGPWWPEEIAVMVSDDGVNYYLAGPELQLKPEDFDPVLTQQQVDNAHNRLPGAGGTLHWYRSCPYEARGRYVGLIMGASLEGVIDLDEVNIYLGPQSGMTAPRPSQVFTEGEAGRYSYKLYKAINERLSRDITTLQEKLQSVSVSSYQKKKLQNRLNELDVQRTQLPIPSTVSFKAILPLNDLHKEIFKVQASLWQVQGASYSVSPSLVWALLRGGRSRNSLRVWQSNRWDPLPPFEEPIDSRLKFELVMAKNSVRNNVLNLSNSGNDPCTVNLTLTDLPALDVFEVQLVDTAVFEPVASALMPVQPTGGVYSIVVQPGMTRQVWLRCSSKNLAAGQYNGNIQITKGTNQQLVVNVPATIEVLNVSLPASLSLKLGGWDYPVHRNDVITNQNVNQYVAVLKEYGVNVTWESGSMGAGIFDSSGNIVVPPSRGEVNYWVSLWPNASQYACVAGITISHTDAEIKSWAIDWANYWQSKGISPDRVMILIFDEAHTEAQLNDILRVGRAIKQVSSFKIWNNLNYANPTTAPSVMNSVMLEACDIQCFNVRFMLDNPQAHDTFMQTNSRPGLQWWCYGNADRASDPYIGWLLWPWFCFNKGLTGVNWWAFTSGNGGFSWNEYFNDGPSYTPLYIAQNSVTISKSMEAMREGAEDYEILKMLKTAKSQQSPGPLHDAMENLLSNRVPQVLVSLSRDSFPWDISKDRSFADSVRIEAMRLLESAGTSP